MGAKIQDVPRGRKKTKQKRGCSNNNNKKTQTARCQKLAGKKKSRKCMTQELMYVHACERIIYIELQRSSDLLLWGEKKKTKKRGKKEKKNSSVQRHPAILLSKSGRSFAQGNLAPVETLKHEVEAVALNLTDTRASRRN